MKKRVLSFLLACLMIVSTFIVTTPHIHVDAVEYKEGINQWTLPMNWANDLDKDERNWELASKNNGLWRLTSFEDLSDGMTVRWAPSTAELQSGFTTDDNSKSPQSYIESFNNRSMFGGNVSSSWGEAWYVNYGVRHNKKAFDKGDNSTYMEVFPGNGGYNNATVVFTAPADNTYDYTEFVKLKMSDAVVEATVRKNGEVLTTATPTTSGNTISGTVELKKDDILMFAFTLKNSAAVSDNSHPIELSNLVVKVHDENAASGGNTVAIGTKYEVPSDFYTGLTEAGTKINGNWQLATYDTKTQTTYYNFGAPSSGHSTAKWYFDNTDPYAGSQGTFRYATNNGEYVLGTNPGSGSHPEMASAVIFTAPDDGVYKFNVDTFSRGLNADSTGSRAVIFFVMKDGVIYDITQPKYKQDHEENMTGEIILKKGEKVYFCAQRYTYYTQGNDHSTDWIGARYKSLSVEKTAEMTAGDEVVTKYTLAPDGTSLIDGQFEMKAYDNTTNTLKDVVLTTGDSWQVKVEGSENWIFQKGRASVGSILGWGPDGNATNANEGAAIVFTAPEKGTYNITGHFLKAYLSNQNGKCYCDYRIIREDSTVVFDGTNFDESDAATGAVSHTLGASVKLEKDEKIYIVKSPNAIAEVGSQRGEIYSLTVAKIAERAGVFVSEEWELPMDWSTGLELDENGWDIPVKGNWALTVFTNPCDIFTRVNVPSAEDVSAAINTNGIGPAPYIESKNNQEATYAGAGNGNSEWYVNAGKRWKDGVVFAYGNNADYLKVGPRNYPAGNSPTVVFTAPSKGLYSYSELVKGVKFTDANGAAVVATATVRKNGVVIDSFTPTVSAPSKTLAGNVVLDEGDLLMFTFTLNTPAAIKDCDTPSSTEQVFNLGKTVVSLIGNAPADYEEIDHTPVFTGDSATSTSGNVVLKGYDVATETLYDVVMKGHPDREETDVWLADDPNATNSWDDGTTSWNEAEYYSQLWGGIKNGPINHIGGSHQYNSGAALVFTVPNDGYYAINARFANGSLMSQKSYSDFVITVNGETVSSNSNYSSVAYSSDGVVATDVTFLGDLKANDVVIIMKKPNANATAINTSNDGEATIQIKEIKNLPAYVEPEIKDPTPSGEYEEWKLPVDWTTTDKQDANGYDLPIKGNWELVSYPNPADSSAALEDIFASEKKSGADAYGPIPYLGTPNNEVKNGNTAQESWYLNWHQRWSEIGGLFLPATLSGTEYVTANVHRGPGAIVFTAPSDNVYTFNEKLVVKNFQSSDGTTIAIGAVAAKKATDGTITIIETFVSSTTAESEATFNRSVELKTGEQLIFGFYNPLSTSPSFVNDAALEKNFYGCYITDLTVSVGVKDDDDDDQGGSGGSGGSGGTVVPVDPMLGEQIGGGSGATGGVAGVGDKWELPTDFYTGMTSAGEKKNGNWQLATYDTKTQKTYYKFTAPSSGHSATSWYFQSSDPYEGQRGTFAYGSRGFETNPGPDNHTELASVIIFTAPADGLYKYDVDTFSYGLNAGADGSRTVIFYIMKDGVIYNITDPKYNLNNTENMTGYIALKQGEQIYFCAQRYTYYTCVGSKDWPAWIGARYDALNVEKVAELTEGDQYATRWHFTPDGTSLTYGRFEMKGYDFTNETLTDATLTSGADWKVTAASGNNLFWKSTTEGSIVGWGPDGSATNANEGAAIVFTAPEDGTYNITGHFEKTYVKSGNGKHYCDYKIILEDGTVVFDGTNYDESAHTSFSYLNHTLGGSVELNAGEKVYIVKSPNAVATVGAQGGDIYSLTVTKVATITPPPTPKPVLPTPTEPAAIGDEWHLPMYWGATGVKDENGWELAVQNSWMLTSFENPSDVMSIRYKISTTAIGKGAANTSSPWSYLESGYNRGSLSGTSYASYPDWYINYQTRWTGTAFTHGDNDSYIVVTPMGVQKKNNPAVVFVAPDDGDYSYSHLVTGTMFEKDGKAVSVTVTVRVNGELVDTFIPTAANASKTLKGIAHLKAGDVLAFVYSQTTGVTLADHDDAIRVGETVVKKVGDYVETNGHHCHGGIANCVSPAICEGCGLGYGEVDLTNHVEGCAPSYVKNATTHIEIWSSCNTTFDPVAHTWVEGKCYVCEYECLHEHDRFLATCVSGAICEECAMAHGEKDPDHHIDGIEFAFEYATKKVHYSRWACCMNEFVKADHTFVDGICTVCELEEGNQGDLAGMLPGTGTDFDVVANPGFGLNSNPITGTISIIAVITATVVSTVTGKAASKKRRRRI